MEAFALSDQEKNEMFYQGLKEEYRHAMGFYDFWSYKQLVEATLNIDSQYAQTCLFSNPLNMWRKRGNESNRCGRLNCMKKSCSRSKSSRRNYTSSGNNNRSTSNCYICGDPGHFSRSCPRNPQAQGRQSSQGNSGGGHGQRGRGDQGQSGRFGGHSTQGSNPTQS